MTLVPIYPRHVTALDQQFHFEDAESSGVKSIEQDFDDETLEHVITHVKKLLFFNRNTIDDMACIQLCYTFSNWGSALRYQQLEFEAYPDVTCTCRGLDTFPALAAVNHAIHP